MLCSQWARKRIRGRRFLSSSNGASINEKRRFVQWTSELKVIAVWKAKAHWGDRAVAKDKRFAIDASEMCLVEEQRLIKWWAGVSGVGRRQHGQKDGSPG
jgi:hypothetical protein